jgi:uncharacterized NAD-dependent epimerase/dehydratase family protein
MVTEKPLAIVLTDGLLHHTDAKTAHGLIRGTDRFSIAAIIDSMHAGKDAGEVLDGQHRNIPVLANVEEAFIKIPGIQFCIIGVATVGGVLPSHFLPVIETCIRHGISIVNGLHDFLNDRPDLAALAAQYGVSLIDIRRPKKRSELHFWDASIFSVTAPVIAGWVPIVHWASGPPAA